MGTKISALTADTAPTFDDLVATVTDPAGTPASRKVTLGNLSQGLGGRLELPISASLVPLTGSSAALEYVESSGAGTYKPSWVQLRYDATSDEARMWNFVANQPMGTPVLKVLYYMASANVSKAVVFAAQLACISDTDTSVTAKVFDTANSATTTVPDAAGTEDEMSITLTNNSSIAVGDRVCLVLYRDADNGSDTASGDCVVTGVRIIYA